MANLVSCKRCNKIYFIISRKEMELQIIDYKKYYNSLNLEDQKYHGKPSEIESWYKCCYCNSNEFNHNVIIDDENRGCTINPIIMDK